MTADPFHITGPALISFSGGRTSAYMLWRVLQAHGGTLPDDVHVTMKGGRAADLAAALVDAAQAVVDNTYVGKHGQTVSERSKYGNYEAKYYHRLRAAIARAGV